MVKININIKVAGSRPRTPPYFCQTLQKYAKELSTGVGRLVVPQMRSIFRRQMSVVGRCLFSQKATGAPSHFVRQGMHRYTAVVNAQTGGRNGYFYITVIPA